MSNGSGWSERFRSWVSRRHGGVLLFILAFAGISLLTRLALLAKAAPEVSWNPSLAAAFLWGVPFDIGAAAFAALPLIVLLTLLPRGFFERRWGRGLALAAGVVVLAALVFGAVAEWTFWDEFGVRFNFIAVDYLVYTTEVMGNIWESYPMPAILGAIAAVAFAMGWLFRRTGLPQSWLDGASEPAGRRLRAGAVWAAACLALGVLLNENELPAFRNNYNRELAKNGLWSLFAAFKGNVLDFEQFYKTMPEADAFTHLQTELVEDGSVLLRPGEADSLRYVKHVGPEQHPNVIQITVESLSADFLGIFNSKSSLTPNLDRIAGESLVFDNFYATGTRTDRGMEALTLSLPPTPGRSIVKRPHNEHLFTLGSVFRAKGYDTAFLYGGFGYFDNMNYYFGNNGYRVIDRNSVSSGDVTFANVWGACDEDLFRWTLREADREEGSGRPFHFFLMTTSNHRPYTFPEGRIDLPSKISGREGAVKYTDYAIGKFLKDASAKSWYRNTVFVIVADHCASSAGKTELPVQNYHIPLIIYAPGGQIAPGHVRTLASQMDYAPTLLGLLNWSYPSRFFGHDVNRISEKVAHALVGNYQKLGHLEDGELVVLSPQRGETAYRVAGGIASADAITPSREAENEAIAFYQTASYLYGHGLYRALTNQEFQKYSQLGSERATRVAGTVPLPGTRDWGLETRDEGTKG